MTFDLSEPPFEHSSQARLRVPQMSFPDPGFGNSGEQGTPGRLSLNPPWPSIPTRRKRAPLEDHENVSIKTKRFTSPKADEWRTFSALE